MTARFNAVEIAKVGTWDASTGQVTITRGHLAAAVAAQRAPGARHPVIKIGHTDPRFDGEPSLGRVENLRLKDRGNTLVGDFTGVPDWLADMMPDSYPDRSLEGQFGVKDATGREHRFAIDAVALLGITPPAISTLESLRDLYDKQPVAANKRNTNTVALRPAWVRPTTNRRK